MTTPFTTRALSHQVTYLQLLLNTHCEIYIFLISGIRLKGIVTGFDDYTLLLANPAARASTQLVYKHSISTILPCSQKAESLG